MFTITSLETNHSTTFDAEGTLRLHLTDSDISVEIMVKSAKNIQLSEDFSPRISLNSEWLTLALDRLPKNDLSQLCELIIEETNDGVTFSGPHAQAFSVGDESAFYYYVDQSLQVNESRTLIRPLESGKFYFEHTSVLDFYKFAVNMELTFTEVTGAAWHHEPEAEKKLAELQVFFEQHFEASKFSKADIKDTGTCFKLTYKKEG